MKQYIFRRLLLLIPILLGVTFLAYGMLLLTGDPTRALAGEHATAEMQAQIRERLGLDQPLPVQYWHFLSGIVTGDWGISVTTRSPVLNELGSYFPATVELAIAAIIIAIFVGIPLGVVAGYKHNTWIDLTNTFGALVGVSMPIFWLALILLYVFALKLSWFPTTGRIDSGVNLAHITNFYVLDSIITLNFPALFNALHHLALPAIALATIPTAFIARMTRSAILNVLGEDYIRAARAKGIREFLVVSKHALRNAMLPVVTVIGLQVGLLLSGAILTETIFAWPGMGRWIVNAIVARNFPVVQAGVLIFALIFVLVNLVIDILYAWLDPRIHYT